MTERQPTASFPPRPLDHSVGADSTPMSVALTSTSGGPVPSDDGPLPRAFGRYELRRLLGRGGMGRVYLAHDPQLDRLVALKMPEVVAVAGWRERFFAEARAAATLTHPNICTVYDTGEVEGQPYLTMAYIEGETLATRLVRDGPHEPRPAVDLVCTIARAMQEAHRRGIVHRDLKPANLMLDSSHRPVITDFGLAIRSTANDDLRLTLTGVALGTPAYMPPEQAGGDHDEIGPQADVYALGVILYELVTGRVPFKAKSFGKLLAMIERDAPPAPSSFNPHVDEALEAVILKCLAKRPADRFDTAGDLADALQRYLEGDRNGLVSLYSKPYVIPDTTTEFRSASPATTAEYRRPQSNRKWWLAGAAAMLLIGLIAASVIYVQTDHGELEVKLSDPKAKVKVRVNGQEVTLEDEGKVTRIKAGKGQKLEVSSPDYETVAETFDLKRGGVTIVQVRLNPRPAVAKKEPDPVDPNPGKKPADPVAPFDPSAVASAAAGAGAAAAIPQVAAKPKPVPFPEKATLIEIDGWQIYADATKEQMQKWLKERQDANHSVMWIDGVQVGDKPAFSAVAALDDRDPKWVVLWDTPASKIRNTTAMKKLVRIEEYWMASAGGYMVGDEATVVTLWRPGERSWSIGADHSLGSLRDAIAEDIKDGYAFRFVRPYNVGRAALWANAADLAPTLTSSIELELTPGQLDALIATARKDGNLLLSVAGYLKDDMPAFATVVGSNKTKIEWDVAHGLTAAQLKAKVEEMAKNRYRPSCVTAYPFDGAVRYCVIWVKEPPKPTPYPKGPTLIEVAGWQIYADATKDQMEKWLEERKKADHSVTWLDVCTVNGKPLYSAAAVLDDRAPKWIAMLDMPAKEFLDFPTLRKRINTEAHYVLSIAGFVRDNDPRAVVLWYPGAKRWGVFAASPNAIIKQDLETVA